MRIGVVSDTHSKILPKQMLEDFKKTDLIIHAGDFCSMDVLETLCKIADVKAVYGNMDGNALRTALSRSQVFDCEGFHLGLFHGEGAPKGLLDAVKNEFCGKKVDVIIFGHSHHPMNEKIDGVLFFNPGSATDIIFAPYQSYGILNIKDKTIEGEIVKIQ
ncbi:MAG: metallophosphoesterase family protein [Candidatus Aceula meridiana]|nr:metallophosphoesterase family protein [Candidatus Aceula meridiana]